MASRIALGGAGIGVDDGKLVLGRRRHIATDTPGSLPIVVVTAANADDEETVPRQMAWLPAVTFLRLAAV